jgi:hypothetical protein
MKKMITAALLVAIAGGAATAQDTAKPRTDKGKLTLFKGANFDMDDYELKGARPSITLDFDVSSIAVYPGEKWQVCAGTRFKEPCMIVDKDMPHVGPMTIQSAKPVKE